MDTKPMIYSFAYRQHGEDQFPTTGPHAVQVIDCRGLWNPHQDKSLRVKTGLHKDVQRRMWESDKAKKLVREAVAHVRCGRPVAFGCSWGKHRSVALAEMTADFLMPRPIVQHTSASMKYYYASQDGGPLHETN